MLNLWNHAATETAVGGNHSHHRVISANTVPVWGVKAMAFIHVPKKVVRRVLIEILRLRKNDGVIKKIEISSFVDGYDRVVNTKSAQSFQQFALRAKVVIRVCREKESCGATDSVELFDDETHLFEDCRVRDDYYTISN